MSLATFPGCKLTWNGTTPESISTRTDSLIKSTTDVYDAIAKLQEADITVASVIHAISANDAAYAVERNMLDFFQHVSSDKALREASTDADKKLSAFEVDLAMRKDVFDVLTTLQTKLAANKDVKLDAEDARFLERMVKNGRRKGLHLEASVRDQLKASHTRESALCIDFQRNLGEDTTALHFTREELTGLDEDFLASLETDEATGQLKVTMKYPHYFPITKKCVSSETRRRLEEAFNSRCRATNGLILQELMRLRAERCRLLGFDSHADFVLDMRMAKDSSTVANFITALTAKLQSLKERELAVFRELKAELQQDTTIHMWDLRFLMNLVEERFYKVDHVALKAYFPMAVVTRGLLDIYQQLLGLKFEKMAAPDVWHPDVELYDVREVASGQLLGYFYLDLHPRDGKYGHAACFGVQPGCVETFATEAGGADVRQVSVAAMVANFSRPTADKPALWEHSEVETFFHEFGHVMHQLCATARHALFAGTAVERDFVEAPSQMLENWCWVEASLSRMSAHYETGEPIPKEMMSKLVASRKANAGIFNLRQMLLSTLDQTIHGPKGGDVIAEEVYARLATELMGIDASPGTNMPATFGHLAGGYDAQYYGYMWSEVFSADMFESRFLKADDGVMSSEVGADYLRCILKPGGSRDAVDMLRDFLGREPNQEAFLRSKGIEI